VVINALQTFQDDVWASTAGSGRCCYNVYFLPQCCSGFYALAAFTPMSSPPYSFPVKQCLTLLNTHQPYIWVQPSAWSKAISQVLHGYYFALSRVHGGHREHLLLQCFCPLVLGFDCDSAGSGQPKLACEATSAVVWGSTGSLHELVHPQVHRDESKPKGAVANTVSLCFLRVEPMENANTSS
jgi:hypothetical protein